MCTSCIANVCSIQFAHEVATKFIRRLIEQTLNNNNKLERWIFCRNFA